LIIRANRNQLLPYFRRTPPKYMYVINCQKKGVFALILLKNTDNQIFNKKSTLSWHIQ